MDIEYIRFTLLYPCLLYTSIVGNTTENNIIINIGDDLLSWENDCKEDNCNSGGTVTPLSSYALYI